jgi:hypothetical protein
VGANALSASQSLDVGDAMDAGGSLVTAAGSTVSIAAGGSIIFTGSDETLGGMLVNAGVLETKGSTVVIASLKHGSGGTVVINGGTLDFLSVLDQAVTFNGATGTLELAQSNSAPVDIAGFKANGQQSLDLGDVAFIGADEAKFSGTKEGGVLTVSDGTHTAAFDLSGNYLGDVFTAASDGHGGTVVTATAPMPSPHAFAATMAAMGEGGAGPVRASIDAPRGVGLFLASPRLHAA